MEFEEVGTLGIQLDVLPAHSSLEAQAQLGEKGVGPDKVERIRFRGVKRDENNEEVLARSEWTGWFDPADTPIVLHWNALDWGDE